MSTPTPPLPEEIERESFAIITRELGSTPLAPGTEPVVKRVIHASADFEYAHTLAFSPGAIPAALAAIAAGTPVVTDTEMAKAGINKTAAAKFAMEVHCLIGDPEVRETALQGRMTRSRAAVDKAAAQWPQAIYIVGNAPTALIRICELIGKGLLSPALVIGVPVGFVNVVESKNLLAGIAGTPHIIAHGRKGGSTIAAAIMNSLLYYNRQS